MLNTVNFAQCIRDNLTERRFGKERADKIIAAFEADAAYYRGTGVDPTQANMLAMKKTFDNLTVESIERAKRTAATLAIQARNQQLLNQAANVTSSMFLLDGKKGGKGVSIARAAISNIEDDPRFGNVSYSTAKENARGQLFAIFGDTLDKMGKGIFGRQKGKAHLPNVVREIFGDNTGDVSAREFAKAFRKTDEVAITLYNSKGGTLNFLDRYLPNPTSPGRMVGREDDWVRMHMKEGVVDWTRTVRPDGKPIAPANREAFLKEVFKTKTLDGANKIDPNAMRGQGTNMSNRHRVLHYGSADGWLEVHEQFADGSVFDVLMGHIEDMSHHIALVDTFGPNARAAATNLRAQVRKAASEISAQDLADADAVMKNKFDPMFEIIMRENPMDPNSGLGNTIVGVSNVLTAAQLGSASFLAIPGDFMQTALVRKLNGMNMFGGVDFYVKTLVSDPKFMAQIATQSGFVFDEVVSANYAATRFTGLATHGPAITRRISDITMRASLLAGHTKAARWSVQAEFMGLLQRSRDTAFEKLPFRRVMERYGIDKEAWDAMRTTIKPWTPRQDVNFMRPIDILDSDLPNKQRLFELFQGMVFEESRKMVPESTIEGTVALKDTSRPDTLVGAILHSFAMYKNFPISFQMIYGRLGMTTKTAWGRVAFYAGLGAGMTMVGALGTQMREISKGREPLPMDNAAFLGKAFLSGGALSIWGDFLFTGLNEYGRGPQDVVGGPLLGFLGDTAQLALGDVFQWADAVGGLGDKDFKSTTAAKAVEWVKRYTPGSSLWWARLALERQVFDRLSEIADPNITRKRAQQVKRQEDNFGNGYWFAPGERTPAL